MNRENNLILFPQNLKKTSVHNTFKNIPTLEYALRVSFKIRPKLILGQSLTYLRKIYGRCYIEIKNIGIFIVLALYDILQLRLIDQKGHIDCFRGSEKSNRTDRIAEKSHFA